MALPNVCACFLAFAATAASTQQAPLDCPRTKGELTIDGVLDEPAWRAAPAATGFAELGSAGTRRAFRQTALRAVHGERGLCLGLICLEPDRKSVTPKTTERDGPVWLEDAVEIFLQPETPSGPAYQFVVSTQGVCYDARGTDAAWNADVQVATRWSSTHWTVEILIPWSDFAPKRPDMGQQWGFNVGREHRPANAKPEWSTWMPLLKGKRKFSVPERFGRLRFVERSDQGRLSFLREEQGLVANPDFDDFDANGLPAGWSLKGSQVTEVAPGTAQHAIGNSSGYFIAGQKLDLPVKPGDYFTAFAVAKSSDAGQIGVAVRRERTDGVGRDMYPFWKLAVTGQYALYVRPIVIPAESKRLIAFNLYRANKQGTVWFDYVQLLPGLHCQTMLTDLKQKFPVDRHPIGLPAVSPHLPVAKPLRGGPIRALCFVTWHAREVHELAQRLDMDYDLVHCPTSRSPSGVCVSCYSYNPDEISARLDGAAPAYDVIVMAARPSDSGLIDKVIAAVQRGSGLVCIDPISNQRPYKPEQWKRLMQMLPSPDASRWAIPWQGRAGVRNFAAGRHGRGRTLRLRWSAGTRGLIPNRSGPGRWWEDAYAVLARACVWAAGRQTHVTLREAHVTAEGRLQIAIDNPQQQTLTVAAVWDHERLPAAAWPPPAEPGVTSRDKAVRVRLPLPETARRTAGRHFATVLVRDEAGSALDWAMTSTTVTPPAHITSLTLDRAVVQPEEEVAAEVALVQNEPTPDLTLHAQLVDAFGRVISAASLPVAAQAGTSTRSLKVSAASPLGVYHRLVVELKHGAQVLDRQSARVLVPAVKVNSLDDFQLACGYTAIPFTPPTYLLGPAVDFLRSQGVTCVMPNAAGVEHGMVGFRSSMARSPHRYSGASHVRTPCFNNPADLQRAVDSVVKGIDAHRPWGFIGYTMWDEVHLHQQERTEVCLCPHCERKFPQWLQRHYPTLAALNAGWATSLTSWSQARPALLADAARGADREALVPNVAQWVDFRRFMEHSWIGMVAQVQAAVKSRWPQARLSFTNPYKFGPLSGTNCWLMAQTEDILLKYFKAANTPRYRSYTRAPMVSWFGYSTDAESCRRYVWWFALNGGAMPIWWDPFEPWEYGGSRSLVPWHMFDPLWQPTGRSEAVTEATADLLAGFGKLLRTAKRSQAQVAIVHSQESMTLAYGLDATRPDGQRVLYKGWRESDAAWRWLLERSGMAYDYVAAEQLRSEDPGFPWRAKTSTEGKVEAAALAGYRVLILPYTLALSQRSAEAIAQFVADGGHVLSDVMPGLADEHGTPCGEDGPMGKLFGVAAAGLPTSAPAGATVPSQVQPLRPAGAKPLAGLPRGCPNAFVQPHGRGRAVCLGFVPSASPESVPVIARLLDDAQARPRFSVAATDGGPADDVETFAFELGPQRFVALVRAATAQEPLRDYRVRWTGPAHVYDSRGKRYLGHSENAVVRLAKAKTAFVSLLPYSVAEVHVTAKDTKAGSAVAVTVQVRPDHGAAGDHVLHLQLVGPGGETPPPYRWNVVAKAGAVRLDLPSALNDAPGRWTVVATDVASGVSGRAEVSIGR